MARNKVEEQHTPINKKKKQSRGKRKSSSTTQQHGAAASPSPTVTRRDEQDSGRVVAEQHTETSSPIMLSPLSAASTPGSSYASAMTNEQIEADSVGHHQPTRALDFTPIIKVDSPIRDDSLKWAPTPLVDLSERTSAMRNRRGFAKSKPLLRVLKGNNKGSNTVSNSNSNNLASDTEDFDLDSDANTITEGEDSDAGPYAANLEYSVSSPIPVATDSAGDTINTNRITTTTTTSKKRSNRSRNNHSYGDIPSSSSSISSSSDSDSAADSSSSSSGGKLNTRALLKKLIRLQKNQQHLMERMEQFQFQFQRSPPPPRQHNNNNNNSLNASNTSNGHHHHHHQVQRVASAEEPALEQQIKSAFISTATNMVGFCFVALLYVNWLMWQPYLTPIFWSLVMAITLWYPKCYMVKYLEGLRLTERRSRTWFQMYWRNIRKLVFEITHPKQELVHIFLFLGVICLAVSYHLIQYLPWFVHVFITPGVVFTFIIVVLLFTLNSDYYHSLVAGLLVFSLVVLSSVFIVFFASKCITEGAAFLHKTLNFVTRLINDKNNRLWLESSGFMVMLQLVEKQVKETKQFVEVYQSNLNTTQIMNYFVNHRNNITQLVPMMWGNELGESFSLWDAANIAKSIGNILFGSSFKALAIMMGFSVSIYDLLISIFLFLACLYYLLQSKVFFLDKLVSLLPVENKQTLDNFRDSITNSIQGIILSYFAVFFSHGLITYTLYSLFNFELLDFQLEFPFISTFISAFTAIFPIISCWILFIPAMVVHFLQKNFSYAIAYAILAIAQILMAWFVDPLLYSFIPESHPYITGLSIVMGMYTFGIQGILIGPLLVCCTVTMYRLIQPYVATANTEEDVDELMKGMEGDATTMLWDNYTRFEVTEYDIGVDRETFETMSPRTRRESFIREKRKRLVGDRSKIMLLLLGLSSLFVIVLLYRTLEPLIQTGVINSSNASPATTIQQQKSPIIPTAPEVEVPEFQQQQQQQQQSHGDAQAMPVMTTTTTTATTGQDSFALDDCPSGVVATTTTEATTNPIIMHPVVP